MRTCINDFVVTGFENQILRSCNYGKKQMSREGYEKLEKELAYLVTEKRAPTEEIIALTQVPIFCPITIGTAVE